MDALELLLTRQSTPRLVAPAPDELQLQHILDAATRAPDHAGLTPWEFIIAQEDGLTRLGNIFVEALQAKGVDEEFIAKAKNMPLRAPMVITVVAKLRPHPKVPEIEQSLAAGCALFAMQQAAFAQGLGGIWRTGELAFDANVHRLLGLEASDQIVGFLYLGTPAIKAPTKALKEGKRFARYL
ncbi:NAD(P)H nitroreductase [Shewanella schlegeliana]|uniref:Putative NAD(P)H nitroreductase n=1 Tax=Shewanella schlegeliana TaxID=190308 RepID=A0ABS1T2S6_9GAMM|nr:NAD(P)H nitroreductase [Shewanella schlegeliana]MBL4915103.1 NAD(P)H nitroreductase [Shewanella schlegeliana]MCL1111031.1 NAD(P)H nitroreductase [Shewanella schlegeliana]GIU29126.1 nitroreductase [Shewanella schlegeliana]